MVPLLLFGVAAASMLPTQRRPGVQRRVRSPQMLRDTYDLVVVGGGPVGVTAALRAASLGHTAILIDATPPRQFQFTGPTGLFSKALRDSALRLDVQVLRSMGIVDTAIWEQVRGFVEQILRKSGDNNAKALALSGVPHLRGYGALRAAPDDWGAEGRCAVQVQFQQQRAKRNEMLLRSQCVLLATGSRAVRLPVLNEWYDRALGGHVRVHDSDSIKQLSFLPRSVVVVGGGIIAVEFARIFAELAADVTMVIRSPDLPKSLQRVGIDREVAYVLQADLIASGVKLLFESEIRGAALPAGASADAVRRDERRAAMQASRIELDVVRSGSDEPRAPLVADLVLSATGRNAVTEGLELQRLDVGTQPNGDVAVDSDLMTSAPGVYAAGDVIGAPQLASTGISQAEAAVDAMFGRSFMLAQGQEPAVTQDCSPTALLSNTARYPIGIWTLPELAFVGLTAAAAAAAPHNLDVVEGIGRYSESIRGHVHTVGTPCEGEYLEPCRRSDGDSDSTRPLTGPSLKLVVERTPPHAVVGVHIFGEDACELIHFGTTLVQQRQSIADILAVCCAPPARPAPPLPSSSPCFRAPSPVPPRAQMRRSPTTSSTSSPRATPWPRCRRIAGGRSTTSSTSPATATAGCPATR